MGEPLSVDEIKALKPGTRIVVTWSGGNGPWEGSVVHDEYLGVCYQSDRGGAPPHALLNWPEPYPSFFGNPDSYGQTRRMHPAQTRPLNRVTRVVTQPDRNVSSEQG